MKERIFFGCCSVLEIERHGLFEYYLSRKDCGNLYFMYGTEERLFPTPSIVYGYISDANAIGFWGE